MTEIASFLTAATQCQKYYLLRKEFNLIRLLRRTRERPRTLTPFTFAVKMVTLKILGTIKPEFGGELN